MSDIPERLQPELHRMYCGLKGWSWVVLIAYAVTLFLAGGAGTPP